MAKTILAIAFGTWMVVSLIGPVQQTAATLKEHAEQLPQ